MKCLGCYKNDVEGYCLPCRKKLFNGKRVAHVLPFKAPQDDNMMQYQEQTMRLSISGVQLKYALKQEGNKLTLTAADSQYILKPIPPATIVYPHQAPENEHLTMQIAAQVFKIKTAANALIYFEDGVPAYITRRFDVRADATKNLQEDFAQLSGKTSMSHGENYKYSGTYEDIGLLIKRYVAAYAPAMEVFFKTVLFNYLLSNGDAHLKNFSLMQSVTGDYELTPAYDLMSTVLHVPNETDAALDLFEGDHLTPFYQTYGHHGYPDFMELARRLGVIEARAQRMIRDMISHTDKVELLVDRSFLAEECKDKYFDAYLDKVKRLNP